MASEVQMINQAVDTAFAEEEAKDVEEAREDWKLQQLENLEGALQGGLLFKEGTDMIEDMLDRRTPAEKAADIVKKVETTKSEMPGGLGETGTEKVKQDPDSKPLTEKNIPTIVQPEFSAASGKNEVTANDYVSGTNLKSFGADGTVVNQPWFQGVSTAVRMAFGWGMNRGDK